MKPESLPERAERVLTATLSSVPFIVVGHTKRESLPTSSARSDFMVELEVAGRAKTLLVELRSNGQPRHARDAVNSLVRQNDELPGAYPIFMAPHISPKSAELCEEAEVGYLDFTGNCRIVFDSVYIERSGSPDPRARKRRLRSLYSPKAERVLRVLLSFGKRPWKVNDLAAEAEVDHGHASDVWKVKDVAGEADVHHWPTSDVWKVKDVAEVAEVSFGQVSNVKRLLVDREWIETSDRGWFLTIAGHEELLKEWAENYSHRPKEMGEFYSPLSIGETEGLLEEQCRRTEMKYGFTAFSAAARWAPHVTYNRATLYVQGITDGFVRAVGIKRVPSGGNVRLTVPYDEGVFYANHQRRDIRVVSPIQAYLDLRALRGRGEEAAEHLLEYIRRYAWHAGGQK